MIEADDFEIFKNNLCTLKETSKDNHDGVDYYMTESSLKVVNFDDVKDSYIRTLTLNEPPKSNDALFFGEDGKVAFIEFKNGQMIRGKKFNVRAKIFDSLLIFTDIIGQGISFTRMNMDYILVYNESKNPIDENEKSTVQESKSRELLKKHVHIKAKKNYVRFGLERFQNLYFNNVYTYTENEFQKCFISKIGSS